MSLYRELADHIAEGRAEGTVEADDLYDWMGETDTGSHPAWVAFDDALDDILAAYRTERGISTP